MVYLLDVASELSPSPTLKSQIFCFFKSAIYCGVHRNTVEYTEIESGLGFVILRETIPKTSNSVVCTQHILLL